MNFVANSFQQDYWAAFGYFKVDATKAEHYYILYPLNYGIRNGLHVTFEDLIELASRDVGFLIICI